MNRLEILSLEPGPDMDNIIHKEIMKLEKGWNHAMLTLPLYSRDISSAWKVVDKMIDDGFMLELIIGPDGYTMATFFFVSETTSPTNPNHQIVCDSAPEAICKSALLIKI